MKAYVINLDKNLDRMAKIRVRLVELGVPFERLSAVYGRELDRREKRKLVAGFRWWCVRGTWPRDGEIGAVSSHLEVYRKLLQSGEPCCCVLEDDDTLLDGFADQLARIEKWVDADKPQVVLMTDYVSKRPHEEWAIVPAKSDSSAEAYVITAVAARRLLKRNFPARMPSDCWGEWVKRKVIELYHAYPTMVPSTWHLPGYVSDVCPKGEKMVRVADMGPFRRVVWKMSRAVGTVLSWLLV